MTSAIAIILVVILYIIVAVLSSKSKRQAQDNYKKSTQYVDQKVQSAIEHSTRLCKDLATGLYVDQKVQSAIEHSTKLRNDLVTGLKAHNDKLVDVLSSLEAENAQLRADLNELKKKLDFYINIEEAAESLTTKEDSEEREQALSAILHGDKILDAEQEFARSYMDNTTNNVFVTGKAGTGKSFLLDAFSRMTSKSHIMLAPTGIAALNVNGATLHSTFGYYNLVNLDVDEITEETIRLKSEKQSVLRRVNTIIIDEISMVRADTFDKIDRILRVVNRSNKPFGGKQMLVFGDLFQLPPVTKGQEWPYLIDRYGGIYFFHSDAYIAGNFKFIELTHNHRQRGDDVFFSILNRIREGATSDEDIKMLNSRYTPNESAYDRYIALFPTKVEAERVNRSRMDKIESTEYAYSAKIILDKKPNKNKSIENVFPVSEVLRLRKGANVMMVANDPDHRWVNGSIGIVDSLSKDRIIVSFGKNRTYEVQPCQFDEQETTYADGMITYEKIFSVMQYPIVPAYAITIHKSQGQTYNNIMCDIDRCFASGQAYVALSRCVSLEGLHLKNYISPASIKVDHDVLEFYRQQTTRDLLQDGSASGAHVP